MTPNGWREVGLTDVASLEMGETLIGKDLSGDGIPVFSAGRDPAPWGYTSLSKKVFRRGTIILGARGTIGYPRLPPFEQFISTQTTIAVTPFITMSSEFLKHVLDGLSFDEITAKQAIPMLTITALRELRFIVPQLREQRKIAAILSAVDDAIERTQAVIDQLQVVKRAMMAELLTRGLPGLHTQFKETNLGKIPAEWHVVKVADIGPKDRPTAQTGPFGAQLSPEDFTNDGVPVLRIGNVQWGRLRLEELDHVRPEKASELSRFRVRTGDLLFARQGATTGRNALADERCNGWLINYHIIRVATDHEKCTPEYLMACFNNPLVQEQVGREKTRGNRDGINTANILGFQIPLPSLAEQKLVTRALGDISKTVEANEDQLGQLQRTKSALMSVLLTGEIRVTPDEATP